MGKFFARLGSVAFIEVVGLRLLHLQNYMQYRAIIFLIMFCGIAVYLVAEICLETARLDCYTDYEISKDENTPTAEDLLDCMEELEQALEKGKNNE